MANPWFRMHSEFADDPKVQILTEPMQRRLVMIFCLRCDEQIGCNKETLHETEIAFKLHISAASLAKTKALFIKKGFIDEAWNVLNWARRQFLSDSSTNRVRKHRRGLKQSETLHGTDVTQDGTAPDTDTDIETEQKRAKTCAAASAAPALDRSGDPIKLPMITGEDWPVSAVDCVAWAKAYPALEIDAELLQAREWLISHPQNRKTPRGMRRFVTSWLSRAQNSARPVKKHSIPFQPKAIVVDMTRWETYKQWLSFSEAYRKVNPWFGEIPKEGDK